MTTIASSPATFSYPGPGAPTPQACTFAIPAGAYTSGYWSETGTTTLFGFTATDQVITGAGHGVTFPYKPSTGAFGPYTVTCSPQQIVDINAAAGGTLNATFDYNDGIGYGDSITSFTLTINTAPVPLTGAGTDCAVAPGYRSQWDDTHDYFTAPLLPQGMSDGTGYRSTGTVNGNISITAYYNLRSAQTFDHVTFWAGFEGAADVIIEHSSDLINWTALTYTLQTATTYGGSYSAVTIASDGSGGYTFTGGSGTYATAWYKASVASTSDQFIRISLKDTASGGHTANVGLLSFWGENSGTVLIASATFSHPDPTHGGGTNLTLLFGGGTSGGAQFPSCTTSLPSPCQVTTGQLTIVGQAFSMGAGNGMFWPCLGLSILLLLNSWDRGAYTCGAPWEATVTGGIADYGSFCESIGYCAFKVNPYSNLLACDPHYDSCFPEYQQPFSPYLPIPTGPLDVYVPSYAILNNATGIQTPSAGTVLGYYLNGGFSTWYDPSGGTTSAYYNGVLYTSPVGVRVYPAWCYYIELIQGNDICNAIGHTGGGGSGGSNVATSIAADVFNGVLALTWCNAAGKQFIATHPSALQQGSGNGTNGWDANQTLVASGITSVGICFLPAIGRCWISNNTSTQQYSDRMGRGAWNNVPSDLKNYSAGTYSSGRYANQSFIFTGSTIYFCRDRVGTQWGYGSSSGVSSGFCVSLRDGRYLAASTGIIVSTTDTPSSTWSTATHTISGTLVGLVYTSSGFLFGLLWDNTGGSPTGQFWGVRSYDKGTTWIKDSSLIPTAQIPAMTSGPPVLVELEQALVVCWAASDQPQFVASFDGGRTWA